MRILRDPEISAFISETKLLPENWQSLFTLKEKSGFQHKERSIVVLGKSGSQFRVILRQNRINTFDFSVILIFQDKDGKEYRLVRYNGKQVTPLAQNFTCTLQQSDTKKLDILLMDLQR